MFEHSFAIVGLENDGTSDLLLANVEALTQGDLAEGSDYFPEYINETKIKARTEVKVEYNNITNVTIEYKRTCRDVITYCKHTGKEKDKCYLILNKTETTCEDFVKQ